MTMDLIIQLHPERPLTEQEFENSYFNHISEQNLKLPYVKDILQLDRDDPTDTLDWTYILNEIEAIFDEADCLHLIQIEQDKQTLHTKIVFKPGFRNAFFAKRLQTLKDDVKNLTLDEFAVAENGDLYGLMDLIDIREKLYIQVTTKKIINHQVIREDMVYTLTLDEFVRTAFKNNDQEYVFYIASILTYIA